MDVKHWIELVASATIPISVIAVVVNRIMSERGLGVRAIQFLGLSVFSPIILILALEGILERSAAGALVGAVVGYLFANIGEYDKKRGTTED
jgi:hypothetical protein